jgi:hypothetical protein
MAFSAIQIPAMISFPLVRADPSLATKQSIAAAILPFTVPAA